MIHHAMRLFLIVFTLISIIPSFASAEGVVVSGPAVMAASPIASPVASSAVQSSAALSNSAIVQSQTPGTLQGAVAPPQAATTTTADQVAAQMTEQVAEGAGDNPPAADLMFEFDNADEKRRSISGVNRKLKRFGYDFFNQRAGFKADPLAQIGPNYIVGPGDTLKIDLWGSLEGHYAVTVDRNGEVVLPRVGVINLWGQSFSEAKQTIETQIFKLFSNLNVNITMGGLRSIQVFVVGEVQTPGTYTVSSLSTVLTTLSQAGGPSTRGSLRSVQLLRGGNLVTELDFYQLLLAGDNSQDTRLQSGDTIFVPVCGPLVGVAGGVRRPAVYELLGERTVMAALELAGGVIPSAYLQKVQIERVEAHQRRLVLDLNFEQASQDLQLPLQDRDLISITPIADAGGYVMLQGYVTRPGKYELQDGMRLLDLLLPYDNLLPDFYPDKAQLVRMSPPLFRQQIATIDLAKALQGDLEHNILLQEYDEVRLYSRAQMEELPQVEISGLVNQPGLYRLYDNMNIKDLITVAGNAKITAALSSTELLRYHYQDDGTTIERVYIDARLALEGDAENNLILQADDHLIVRSISTEEDVAEVKVSGAVFKPGTFALIGKMRVRDLLIHAGNLRRKASQRQAELTRFIHQEQGSTVERLMIDLEKALAGDPDNNLLLQEDDHLFVRTMPEYDDKRLIEIRGEVVYPGTYVIGVGETLSSVLERAGGYTDKSYIAGAVFVRESLKAVQQQRISKLIADQEAEILQLQADLSSGAMTEAEVLSANQVMQARRSSLQKLQDANATGRMVVQLQDLEQLTNSIDDVLLMNGDRLMIPENPHSLSVLGEVYNPTSLSYRPGQTVKYYLEKVGGATKDADEKEMFVVRADGTVLSYAQHSGFGLHWDFDNYRWIWGGFNSLKMYPGDTLLVPEDLDDTDWIKEGRDISQIVYQLALGAAAVASF